MHMEDQIAQRIMCIPQTYGIATTPVSLYLSTVTIKSCIYTWSLNNMVLSCVGPLIYVLKKIYWKILRIYNLFEKFADEPRNI